MEKPTSDKQPNMRVRKNGFSFPWNGYQLFMWAAMFTQISVVHLVIMPAIEPIELKVVYTLVIDAITLFVFIFGILTAITDPS